MEDEIVRRLQPTQSPRRRVPYLRVKDGFLELGLPLKDEGIQNWDEWKYKIGEGLLDTPDSYQACALLTGGSCAVFVHKEEKTDG